MTPLRRCHLRLELTALVDRLEAAAHAVIPATAQYTTDWAPPEDVERWHTAEQLASHQADLQRLRPVLEQLGVNLKGHCT